MNKQMMRKYADTDIARASILTGLGATGGWAFNKYVLGNKSLKSQILSAAIGGLLGGGGSIAYDVLTADKGHFAKKHEELKARGSNELANWFQNALGTYGLTAGGGALGISAARSGALLTDKLTYGDSLSNIDVEPSSTVGKTAKRYIMGLPDKLSQKSWSAAADVDKVNAAREALFGRAHVKLSPIQMDAVNSLVSDSGLQRVDTDIADTQKTIAKLKRDVNTSESAAMTAGKTDNTQFYNESYKKAVSDLKEAESKLEEQVSLRRAIEDYRKAGENVHTTRGLLGKLLFGKGNRYKSRGDALKQFWNNRRGVLRRYIKGGAIKSGSKIGLGLSVAPVIVDGLDNLVSWLNSK